MKNFILLATSLLSFAVVKAQDLNDILLAGVEDANQFASPYLTPLMEAGSYSMANGWFNTADAKPLLGFEISLIGNITGFKNNTNKQSFILDPAEYQSLDFVDNPGVAQPVATALGDIEGTRVFVGEDATRVEFELPTGLLAENLNFVPSGFLQGSVGLIKGLEVKGRFLPSVDYDGTKVGLFGAGLQYEFTKLLPADKLLPIAISAVVGYTNLNGEYDFTATSGVQGDNQTIDASFKTWNISAVVSTRKIPVINFYGAMSYMTANSNIDVLGTYEITAGPNQSVTYTNPIQVANKTSGVMATIGTKLKLGFFRLNAEYTMAEFSTVTVGMHLGFR